ncbi:RF-1 domain-containing protein [Blastocladiella britannica]|nr:RF-1 domain-containing protein [Blastocladiella britannica]
MYRLAARYIVGVPFLLPQSLRVSALLGLAHRTNSGATNNTDPVPPPLAAAHRATLMLPTTKQTAATVAPAHPRDTSAQKRVPIVLNEDEIDEKFIKGSGNGGQKVNKTSNCVVLTHRPTGTQVRCHETRSLHLNRKNARKLLMSRLDDLWNGILSKNSIREAIERRKKQKKAQKARKKHGTTTNSTGDVGDVAFSLFRRRSSGKKRDDNDNDDGDDD